MRNESNDLVGGAVLYGGTLRDGGATRPYRKVLHLDNDISEDPSNTNEYAVIHGSSVSMNELTIGFWVYPIGVSENGAGVVVNRRGDDSYGVVINSNGGKYLMGYVWGDPSHNFEFDLNVEIPPEQWTYIVVIIYATGIAKLFGNNKFLGFHDMGFVRDPIMFDNIELGRFSGMLDDVRIYPTALDYGSVPIGSTARSEVSYLYHTSRVTGEVHTQIVATEDVETEFHYIQSKEYVTAYENYVVNRNITGESTDAMLNELYVRQGGTNDGTYSLADGSFRTFHGKIYTENDKDRLSSKKESEIK